MKKIIELQQQLVPDAVDLLKRRYTILRQMMSMGIVGRRTLASTLDMTERVLRADVDFLKVQGLIVVETAGMKLSTSGMRLLEEMDPYISDLFGLSDMEERIGQVFGIRKVIIVPGDSDTSPLAKKELGRAGAMALRKYVAQGEVIAVTGGSTMAEVAQHLTASSKFKGSWFVPARGGLGESLELQANTVASTMAKQTGSQYRLLHVPDDLSEEAYLSLIHEPNVKEILEVIRQARIVVHGIGEAIVMANRRGVSPLTQEALIHDGALAEAFGFYFDHQGQVVHHMPTVGLRLEDIANMDLVIAVAGGRSKGVAIASLLRSGYEDVLVTDESAAQEILRSLSGDEHKF